MALDTLSLAFAALSDPTRRAILARLASGEATVGQLAEPFDMSSPAISKHLKVLERAGLVETSRQAQSRPRRLVAQPLQQATDWLEHYRPFWEAKLDRLDDYVRELKLAREKAARKTARKKTTRKTTQR
jgi:DNA-binding transcriptional ArsR family regulator